MCGIKPIATRCLLLRYFKDNTSPSQPHNTSTGPMSFPGGGGGGTSPFHYTSLVLCPFQVGGGTPFPSIIVPLVLGPFPGRGVPQDREPFLFTTRIRRVGESNVLIHVLSVCPPPPEPATQRAVCLLRLRLDFLVYECVQSWSFEEQLVNKKVLLRERKRHTAHRVASARYAALSHGLGGGLPPTIQTWSGGYPPTDLRWGTPHLDLGWGNPPRPEMGYPHLDLGRGTPTQT